MIGLSPKRRKSKKHRERSALKVTKDPSGSSTLSLSRLMRIRGAATAYTFSISKEPARSLLSKRQGVSTPPSSILIQSLSRQTLEALRLRTCWSTGGVPATYSLGIPSNKWELPTLL